MERLLNGHGEGGTGTEARGKREKWCERETARPGREGEKERERVSGQRRAERTTQLHCSSNTCKSGE